MSHSIGLMTIICINPFHILRIVPDLFRTFMTYLSGIMSSDLESCDFVTHIAELSDTGAEFANLSRLQFLEWQDLYIRMTLLANSAEFVDCKFQFIRLFSLLLC